MKLQDINNFNQLERIRFFVAFLIEWLLYLNDGHSPSFYSHSTISVACLY